MRHPYPRPASHSYGHAPPSSGDVDHAASDSAILGGHRPWYRRRHGHRDCRRSHPFCDFLPRRSGLHLPSCLCAGGSGGPSYGIYYRSATPTITSPTYLTGFGGNGGPGGNGGLGGLPGATGPTGTSQSVNSGP